MVFVCLFFFLICSQTLSRYKVELFYAAQNKITKWMNDFLQYIFLLTPKRKSKMVVLLMWWVGMEWPYGLLDIAHQLINKLKLK